MGAIVAGILAVPLYGGHAMWMDKAMPWGEQDIQAAAKLQLRSVPLYAGRLAQHRCLVLFIIISNECACACACVD